MKNAKAPRRGEERRVSHLGAQRALVATIALVIALTFASFCMTPKASATDEPTDSVTSEEQVSQSDGVDATASDDTEAEVATDDGMTAAEADSDGTMPADDSQAEATQSEPAEEPTEVAPTDEDATPAEADTDEEPALAEASTATVTYHANVQGKGWQDWVYNFENAGTFGESRRIEAFEIKVDTDSLPSEVAGGGIRYRAHVQGIGWQGWVANGETAGTIGQSRRIEAIRIELTGDVANYYDVYYRVHVQNYGWMAWAKNGADAGTSGMSKRIEAIQVALVLKDNPAPTSTSSYAFVSKASVSYQLHVQGIGWQSWVKDGALGGTSGQSRRVEALRINVTTPATAPVSGGIEYCAHVEGIGWQSWVANGAMAGTSGQSRRVEAIRIRLTGDMAKYYDVYYRVHAQSVGWMNWAKNGAEAGTAGMSKRVEALEIVLVPRGGTAPTGTGFSYIVKPSVGYQTHIQSIGWQAEKTNGATSGCADGQSLRIEAMRASLSGANIGGSLTYRTHVQGIGWQSWVSDGAMAGTSGQSRRVESIQMKLTGDLARYFDVYYRARVESVGWLDWAKNGATAGSVGLSLRIEAIQVIVRPKGGTAFAGPTARPMIDKTVGKIGYQNPAGYYQVSINTVRLTAAAYSTPFSYVTPSRIRVNSNRAACVNAFLTRAKEYIGTPYVWDYSRQPGVGVDCIGLVYQCAYATGMDMGGGTGLYDFNPYAHYYTGSDGWHSHDSNNFWNYGKALHVSLSSRQAGDLIFWSGHVAIYVGGDQIIEAWPGVGVRYASLWVHGTPWGAVRLYQ